MTAATQLAELLGLERQPVAIAFRESAPEGIAKIDTAAPSGCTYWKYASEGRTFYTEASDHYGCPIGAHTHGIDLPEETAKELEGLLSTMVQLQYIAMEEVAAISQLEKPPGVVIYAPAAEAAFEPDVVLVCGNAKQMMLLAEAAHLAGLTAKLPWSVGRLVRRFPPSCKRGAPQRTWDVSATVCTRSLTMTNSILSSPARSLALSSKSYPRSFTPIKN